MEVSHLLEVVNLPPFDLDGEHYERHSLVLLDLLSQEWGGNVVQQYLQSGRLRLAHPEARSYVDGEMYGEHARLLVSDNVEAFGPGVGTRLHEQLHPTEAPSLPGDSGASSGDEIFDPFAVTAPEVRADTSKSWACWP